MSESTTTDVADGPARTDEAAAYLDAVAARLAGARDLSEADRRELLDDLALHLVEVAAEDDTPLVDRLGPPAAYAGELLASAGVETGRVPPRPVARAGAWWRTGRGRVERWAGDPRLDPVREARPDLISAWWVLRGWLLAVLLGYVTGGGGSGRSFPLPPVLGSAALGLVAVVGAVIGSVIAGRRLRDGGPPSARMRWLNRATTVVCVIVALVVTSDLRTAPPAEWSSLAYRDPCPVNRAGERVDNLYAYDAEGHLLDPVLLYDQTGLPVQLCPSYRDAPGGPVDANGARVPNAFPRAQIDPFTGQPVAPPAVVIPRLSTTTTVPSTTSTTAPPGTATTTVP